MLTKWRNALEHCEGTNPWKILKKALEDVGRFDLAKDVEIRMASWKSRPIWFILSFHVP